MHRYRLTHQHSALRRRNRPAFSQAHQSPDPVYNDRGGALGATHFQALGEFDPAATPDQ